MNAARISLAVGISIIALSCRDPQSAPRATHHGTTPSTAGANTNANANAPALPPGVPTEGPTLAPLPENAIERIAGDARDDEALPLIIALHGLGDAPEDFVMLFTTFPTRARVIALAGYTQYSPGYSWFPPGADPATPAFADAVEASAHRVAQDIRAIRAARPSCDNIIVMGFSQGAMLAYTLAAIEPDIARRFVPVAGRLGRTTTIAPSTNAGDVRAFHGGADNRVPIADGRAAVARLHEAGRDAQLREFPAVHHDITPDVKAAVFAVVNEVASRGCPAAH